MDSLARLNLNTMPKFMNFSANCFSIYQLVTVLTKKCLLLMVACFKKMA